MLIWAIGVVDRPCSGWFAVGGSSIGWREFGPLPVLRGLWRRRGFWGAAWGGWALPDYRPSIHRLEVSGPVAIGIFRPRVVLPERLASAAFAAISASGCACSRICTHIVRGDTLIARSCKPHRRCAVLAASAGSPPERSTCEIARGGLRQLCTSVPAIPRGYSRTLHMQLSEIFSPKRAPDIGLGLSDTRWTLRDRVEGILDPAHGTG